MKILILSDDFPPEVAGGAGVMAFRTAKEFIRQGHEVRVVAATKKKNSGAGGADGVDNISRIVFEGITIERFYSAYHDRWRSYVSLWNPRAIRFVKKILEEFQPDVVHAHNIHAHISYAALGVARRSGAAVFVTTHDIMPFYPGSFTEFINPKDLSCPTSFNYKTSALSQLKKFRFRFNPLRNFFIRRALKNADRVIAVSHALKDALIQNGIQNVSVIQNGIDVAGWQISDVEAEVFKRNIGCEETDIVLFGGRLSGAKGAPLMLEAMKSVVVEAPNARLVVVGRIDAYAERMKVMVKKLGLDGKVVFAGWLAEDEIKKAYRAAEVVVTPSVCFDSFPTNNLEAFASGRPAIATCFGGSREVVAHGENGYIVNPFNTSELAQHIVELLLDKDKAKMFGKRGNQLVITDFSIQKMAHGYLSLFSK